MDYIPIGVALIGIVLLLKAIMPKADVLKGLKIKTGTAALIGILILAGGAIYYNWGNNGIMKSIQGVQTGTPSGPSGTSGVVFAALGSENDSNLLYDATSHTFSCTIADNAAEALNFSTVTFTLTVYRTDTVSTGDNPPVCSVGETSVPTFMTIGDANTYSPIALTSLGQWNITVTPASGNALYQTAYGTVADGGSKAFVVVVTLSHTGFEAATAGTVYSAQFSAAGTVFTLNMVIGTDA